MKIAVERYFQSLKDMQDEVSTVLGDWSTPQSELVRKCEEVLIERTKDIG
jgi:hypothetical protein